MPERIVHVLDGSNNEAYFPGDAEMVDKQRKSIRRGLWKHNWRACAAAVAADHNEDDVSSEDDVDERNNTTVENEASSSEATSRGVTVKNGVSKQNARGITVSKPDKRLIRCRVSSVLFESGSDSGLARVRQLCSASQSDNMEAVSMVDRILIENCTIKVKLVSDCELAPLIDATGEN